MRAKGGHHCVGEIGGRSKSLVDADCGLICCASCLIAGSVPLRNGGFTLSLSRLKLTLLLIQSLPRSSEGCFSSSQLAAKVLHLSTSQT